MAVLKATLLLLMLVLSTRAAPTPEECQTLYKTLTKADLQRFSGEWVLVWSTSENSAEQELWSKAKSSYLEVTVLPGSISYTERNLFAGDTCINYHSNMSVTSEDQLEYRVTSSMLEEQKGVLTPFDDNGVLKFYETCADCLLMEYRGNMGRFLLVYRREGLHRDAEMLKAAPADGQKLAECFSFPPDVPFLYDGVTDFCHKKSAPEVKPEEA